MRSLQAQLCIALNLRWLQPAPGILDRKDSAGSSRFNSVNDPDSLAHLAWLAYWLDEGFRIPSVGVRFGWDAIAKLIPVVGDALGLIASLYLFSSLRRLELPRVTRPEWR